MNAIIIEHPAWIRDQIRNLAHLAHTQSRVSVQLAQWAKVAEAQGKTAAANHFAQRSADKRFEANWHLQKAVYKRDHIIHVHE